MRQVALESNAFLISIEYIAIFCWGLIGGLTAIRKGYDFFAILITSWLTALGGGVIRDVLLGIAPVGISDKGMVVTALVASLAVVFIHPEVAELEWPMTMIDAFALGLFAVNGTAKALLYHSSGMTAIFLGMATALGGGLIRDMILNQVSTVIADPHWYAVPTLIGCLLTVFVTRAAQRGVIGFGWEMGLDICIVLLVVLLRILSVRFNWTVPRAMPRQQAHLPQAPYLRRPVIRPDLGDSGSQGAPDEG
ncbi:hypothetical protein CRD60_00025 [Bifidobacterium aemilianum]|uniref:Glycine transporter domain-containing protein n=1 Tax=Bifidobacterium aemilianum TaxID=2493120 RepID=A0A366K998_9BIFI|nr:TRIC cation channel family protein [Bifidobacterium aemilianum]RBP98315.1 hypothetical protein CRD60_00025 [Bifidobacterium aemilianum]